MAAIGCGDALRDDQQAMHLSFTPAAGEKPWSADSKTWKQHSRIVGQARITVTASKADIDLADRILNSAVVVPAGVNPAGCPVQLPAVSSVELAGLDASELTVCLSCHDKENLGTPPLKNIKRDLAGKKFLHGPIQKGQCTACHDPHGSDYFRMLRGNYPSALYAPYREGLYDACLKCHGKDLLKSLETTTATRFRNGVRNLHSVHVANRNKGRTCRICHSRKGARIALPDVTGRSSTTGKNR